MSKSRMRWSGYAACIQKKDPYKTMARKLRALARPRQRWENNIKMYLQETKWEGVDFNHLVQDTEQ
jgi:hypothetical protein